MYSSLRDFIQQLENQNELIRIKEPVTPDLEISEITDRVSKQHGKALLFENTGTGIPLLINAFGSEKRMCMALGVNHLDDVTVRIETLFKTLMKPKDNIIEKLRMLPQLSQMASWMPKVVRGKGACQGVINMNPDITKFPVMKCWPEDGGPFITLPVIHTKDPNTNIRNVGMYRMQIFSPTVTGMHWHKHKVSARHFQEYKKLGIKMPVAVALGGDPVYTYCATAPLPDNIDEYMLAGFLRNKKVELVQCITQDVQVPADAEIIIEGYVDPAEKNILEGPFGDHTGYYSLADFYPKFHITCITHRKNPIYPSTIVGIPPQEDAWLGKATERIFLAPIKMTMIPEIKDMELPIEGVFHNLTIVKIKKEYAGQAIKVTNAMWGAGQMMFNKILVIVDEEINIHDYKKVAQIISENVDPQQDIYFSQGPMDVLDHSCTKFSFGGKMCVDATRKLPEELRVMGFEFRVDDSYRIDSKKLMNDFTEIVQVNDELLSLGISIVFLSVQKNRKNHLKELSESLFRNSELSKVKFVIFLEANVDCSDLKDAVWRFTNNIDPRRDSFVASPASEPLSKGEGSDADVGHPDSYRDNNGISHIAFDGTRKTKEFDNFDRDWPNILAMDEKTISLVDEKWESYDLGKFIHSPSLKYRKQLYKGGAVAE